MSRRLIAAACAAAALALGGCGSSDDGGSDAAATSAEAASGYGEVGTTPYKKEPAAFPATIAHKYGSTTVKRAPKRIVSVGLTEHDILLQLGEKPIAVTDWYGDQPYATWPWAKPYLGSSKPTVLKTDDGFEFEKIAALRPDLIIGVNAGMKRSDYDKLSKIAPTIGPGANSPDYFSNWKEQTTMVAAAIGRVIDGEALFFDTMKRFDAVAKQHPDFAGKTVSFAQNAFYSGLLYAYPEDLNTEFLTMLGFKINPKLTPLVKKQGEQVGISEEKLDVLDADAIVFATEQPEDITNFLKVPTFTKLDAVAKHRAVFTDATLSGAMYFMTPLAMNYVAEKLPPLLQQALDGKAPREMQPGTAPGA